MLFSIGDTEHWRERVDKLATQGLAAPDAVLNTLTRMIERDVLDESKELAHPRKTQLWIEPPLEDSDDE